VGRIGKWRRRTGGRSTRSPRRHPRRVGGEAYLSAGTNFMAAEFMQ
jgi:hypothetical protein